jgi:hypothetical protein
VIKVKGLNQKGFCLKIKVLIKFDFLKNFQHSANFQNFQNLKNLLKKLFQKLEKFKPSGWN